MTMERFKNFINTLLFDLNRLRIFRPFLRFYYSLAVRFLRYGVGVLGYREIKSISVKHRDWILGMSDIDLIIVTKSMKADEEMDFFRRFIKFYRACRLFFFILCPSNEIRFIREGDEKIYPSGRTRYPFPDSVRFNLYGFLQEIIFQNEHIGLGQRARMEKSASRIKNHINTIRFSDRLIENSNEKKNPVYILKDILLNLTEAYQSLDKEDITYLSSRINEKPKDLSVYSIINNITGKDIEAVAYKEPYKFYRTNLFLLIDKDTPLEIMERIIRRCRKLRREIEKKELIVRFSTSSLITNQMYYMNGPIALESYFLQYGPVYDSSNELKIIHPPRMWNIFKIKEFAYRLKEFFLPFLMFYRGEKSRSFDFFTMPEIRLLIYYYLFLESADNFIGIARETRCDSCDLISKIIANYGDALGCENWYANKIHETYPVLYELINKINEKSSRLIKKRA